MLKQTVDLLGAGKPLGTRFFAPEDEKLFAGFGFLTSRPLFAVVNTGEATSPTTTCSPRPRQSASTLFRSGVTWRPRFAPLPPKTRRSSCADLGIEEPAQNRFLRHVYATLHLMSFFTVGEDECKAWSITGRHDRRRAAGEIHSDLAKGFIRAEVVPWKEMLDSGRLRAAQRRPTRSASRARSTS